MKNTEEKVTIKILDTRKEDLEALKGVWCLNKSCRRCMFSNRYYLRYCAGIPSIYEWTKERCFEERRYAKEKYKEDVIDFISFLKSIYK